VTSSPLSAQPQIGRLDSCCKTISLPITLGNFTAAPAALDQPPMANDRTKINKRGVRDMAFSPQRAGELGWEFFRRDRSRGSESWASTAI
jgi:hypothetical protein